VVRRELEIAKGELALPSAQYNVQSISPVGKQEDRSS
jgi:hypothetical protein